MKALELVLLPSKDSIQSKFEVACVMQMGLKLGVLAIHHNQNRYCNEHIQWLWEQYSKEFQ